MAQYQDGKIKPLSLQPRKYAELSVEFQAALHDCILTCMVPSEDGGKRLAYSKVLQLYNKVLTELKELEQHGNSNS